MANDGTVKIGTSIDESGFKKGLSKLGNVAKASLKATTAAIGTVATAATGAVTGLLALESATEEYRIAQGKLNTAFEAAGYSSEAAQEAYQDFYKILGDTDTATEASQLLAKLAENEEDVSTWTNIAAGVFGTFGDSLPIEGLIESANETAKVGKVTGVLADALNWAGISEDVFNKKLAACTSESERNQLIMDTLSGTYDEASEAFYRNNEELIRARENQALLDETLAKLGETISKVKNNLISEFLPGLSQVVNAFNDLINGVDGADEALSDAIGGLVESLIEKLPEFLAFGLDILTAILQGIIDNLPVLVEGAGQIVLQIISAITELLPQLLNVGVEILKQIAVGIRQGVQEVMAALPQIIEQILAFFAESLPLLADIGLQILLEIANGIEQGLPELAASIPSIIQTLIQNLTNSMPTFIEMGGEIITSIANGIIEAVPILIESLPDLIVAITDFYAQNYPKLISVGIELVLNIIAGMIEAIPQLVASLPELISAIIVGLGNLIGGVVDVGRAIVEGLWEGISGAADWLMDKIGGWVDTIIDGIKSLFDINSPSGETEYVGDMLDEGIAVGVEKNVGKIKSAIKKLDFTRELAGVMPDIQQRVTLATSAMAPPSVYADPFAMQRVQVDGQGQNSGTSNNSSRQIVIRFEGELSQFAQIITPYIDEEHNRLGEALT